jgi:phosphoribosylpyrophosphate synthetase
MEPLLIAGRGNVPLAESIARRLKVELVGCKTLRFPDGELHVELEDAVRGEDVRSLSDLIVHQ